MKKESLFIAWDEIEPIHRRGDIIEYSIKLTKIFSHWEINPVETSFSFNVYGNLTNTSISNLQNYTKYHVELSGATKVGYGPNYRKNFCYC